MLRFTPALCALLFLVDTAGAQVLNRVEAKLRQGEPGYLGVVADDRGENGAGVRVLEVTPDGPAAQAGVRVNDLITAVDGRPIRTLDDMGKLLAGARVGTNLQLTVERGRELKKFQVTLAPRPTPADRIAERIDPHRPDPAPALEVLPPADRRTLLGVRTVRMNATSQIRLRTPTVLGALVTEVIADSPAAQAGLAKDDVIVGAGKTIVTQPADLAAVVANLGGGKMLEISYYRQAQLRRTKVTLASTVDPRKAEGVVPPPVVPPPDIPPAPVPPGAGGDRTRIELLERRVAELERRVAELEHLLRNAARQR